MGDSSWKAGFKNFVAGGGGGISLVCVGHPLDTVKVRMQTAEAGEYRGIVHCIQKIMAEDGFMGLYRGVASPLITITPIFATYFLGFEHGKQLAEHWGGVFAHKDGKINYNGIFAAGAFSSIYGTVIMVPGERVKVMLQTHRGRFKGVVDCTKFILREQGVAGLYRGTLVTLLRDAPGSAAYYGGYAVIKDKLVEMSGATDPSELSVPAILTAGGLAGICNWLVSVPPDVVKTRIQTADPGRYPGGAMQCVREMVMKEGISSLFKGLGPAIVRAFPANAACFMGYEWTMKVLNEVMDEEAPI